MAAQTFQAQILQECESIDYTPVGAIGAGNVVVVNGVVLIALLDIAAGELGAMELNSKGFKVVKDTSVFAAFDPVYWNATGDPVGGTAGTGAATSTAAGNVLMGVAILAAATGVATVNVKMTPGQRSVAPSAPVATVVAIGADQAGAAPVATGFTLVSAADGAVGVRLPAAAAGLFCEIKNNANAALKVYPATGDTINAIAANGAISMAAFTSAIFRAYNGTAWYTVPLVPS